VPVSTFHNPTDMTVDVSTIDPAEHGDEAVKNPAPDSFEGLTA